ncbi:MAG: hypothetical protein FWC74_02675 [Candidatus Bathyarchaeota archaeon]|nr:hypothetical protein [Candidatus Termitimicrobium sp.]
MEFHRVLFLELRMVFSGSGDKHNERGNINKEPLNRRKMMDKRIGKLEVVDREVPMEFRQVSLETKTENIVVSWGSTKGAIIESLNQLREENKSLGYLQVRMIHPFPSAHISSSC